MDDFRVWWILFVFFASLGVLVVRRRYLRWRRVRDLLEKVDPRYHQEVSRGLHLEGWRMVLMAVSLLAMTGVVATVFWPGPAALLDALLLVALLAVLGVLLLSLRL